MSGLLDTFREATLLQCSFLEKLLDLDMACVADFSASMAEFLQPSPDNKFVYGLAAGRSALALYSFLQLMQNHFENVFPFTLEDPVQRHYRKGKNLGIAISGSGETLAVNKYIDDFITRGGEIKLITANENGTAYKMVSEYERGSTLVIKARTKHATNKDMRSRLSPLGTEFELEVLAFLNALFADIQSRLKGICEPSCPEYRSTVKDFEENARLISEMEPGHLEHWFKRLLPRSGRYVVGGVGRSGLVARAFEMRLTHLNKISYWERDFNTPSFQIGDVYVPITGIGNTYEAMEGSVTALSMGADVMPITANRSSRLVSLLRKHGRTDDIAIVPVKPEYADVFSGDTSSTTWLMSDFTKFRYPIFEINSSVFTNSIVAVGAEFLGIVEAGMRRMHV
ncbi:MAG: 3-hexulose-6-phosphate isomerase [Methanosaeta sp. PtaB.Bin018]|jgi:D-arabinose 5-phosphate isomerase GutQ|nr:sugar phosphate isomerase [Methanothrix sp.]OPX75568.1 MAG: 3-hexulose-6-phosphate isomerase [Methanosaeta sp. PtaB.Bin018]OPY46368.1 MAG: 3-hexulose-6-phosphate isomerase [Methanosaeta sp. PtaU1.Bin016]